MPTGKFTLVTFVALLLVSACGQPVAGEAVAGERVAVATVRPARTSARPRVTTIAPRPSTSVPLAGLAGTWEGEYTCGQGNTGLKLTIKAPAGGTLPAVFDFFPLPGNPSAAKGSYSMIGRLAASGQLVFKQDRWIDQPPGYLMVDLAVTSPLTPDAAQLSGDVLDPSCKGFSVRRR